MPSFLPCHRNMLTNLHLLIFSRSIFRQERDLMTRTDRFGVEVRERVMWDIREGVVGSDTFIPKHVVFITWKNMSFAGGIDNSLFKTNSFQMVLATDEVYTYAIMNYAEINWSSHTEAGGDTTGGEGGVPAYVSILNQIVTCLLTLSLITIRSDSTPEMAHKRTSTSPTVRHPCCVT
jgi:hypothetical protein